MFADVPLAKASCKVKTRFKRWKYRLHFLIGGAESSHCAEEFMAFFLSIIRNLH
jgi:hypothetical protein